MKFTEVVYDDNCVDEHCVPLAHGCKKMVELEKFGLYDGVRGRVTAIEEFQAQWTDELITEHWRISEMSKLASHKDVWITLFILLVIKRQVHDRFLARSQEREKHRDLNMTASFVAREVRPFSTVPMQQTKFCCKLGGKGNKSFARHQKVAFGENTMGRQPVTG